MDLSNHSLFTLLDAIAMPTIVFTKDRESCFINKKAHEVLKNTLATVTVDSINSLLDDIDLTDLTVPLVAQKSISGGNQNTIDLELNITKYTNEGVYYICSLTINSSKQPLNLLEKKMALTQKKLGLFDVFINRIKEGILVFNFDGKLVYTNEAAEKTIKIKSDELLTVYIWEIFKYFDNIVKWKEILFKINKKEFVFTEKIKNKHLLIELQKRNFEGDDYYLLICNDITENLKDKVTIEEKNTQIDFFQSHFPVALFQFHVLKNKVHYFHHVSKSFYDLFGFNILTHYKSWLSRLNIHPEDVSSFLEAAQQSILYNENFKFTGRMLLKDKSVKWFEAKAIPVFQNNKIVFNGIIWDISQQKIADFEIRKKREFNDSILFNIPADVAVFDKNHNYLFINPNGVGDPEIRSWLIGKNDFDYCKKRGIDTTMAQKREDYFQEAKRTGNQVEWIDEIVKNNVTHYVLRRFYPFYVENEFAYMIGYGIDISDIKNLQNLLSKTEKQNNLIMQSSLEGIVIIDADCTISFWNTKAEEIFGWNSKQIIGKNLPELIFPKDNKCFKIEDYFKKMEDSVSPNKSLEMLAITKNKINVPIEMRLITVDDKDYQSKYFVFIRDISSQKEREEKIQLQNEMLKRQNTELEQFNYIASHDLQEPLLTITGYSNLLKEEFSPQLNEEGKLFLNFINNSANRMRFLISGLLEYNRINKNSELQTLDLSKTITDVTEDLSAIIKENKAVIITETLPTIQCYPIFIRLLFQNLISNALKFRKDTVNPIININAHETEEYWQFEVKDNGIGIEEKYFEQIFQIFRRLHTAEEYSGYGIGLAHCKKIVDIHNGSIWINSTVNHGASFFFTISKKY